MYTVSRRSLMQSARGLPPHIEHVKAVQRCELHIPDRLWSSWRPSLQQPNIPQPSFEIRCRAATRRYFSCQQLMSLRAARDQASISSVLNRLETPPFWAQSSVILRSDSSAVRVHIEDWEDIKFSFDAEPAVSRWERACQGSVEIYVRFVEDGCEPFGRVLARL